MAETTADVRRDIELTRERMSTTMAQLEQKLNVAQVIRDHPWPSLALAAGLGAALALSKLDAKSAAATVAATGGASSKLGGLLDDVGARLITGASDALNERIDSWVDELKSAIGAPPSTATPPGTRVPRERAVTRTVTREGVRPEAEAAAISTDRGQFVGREQS